MNRQRKVRWIGAAILIAAIMATALSANTDGGRSRALSNGMATLPEFQDMHLSTRHAFVGRESMP